ncbi:MAG: rhodanese-like domain-containing protein [Myxococcaceae bacterium]|nr:rhodanese-like domain-containing protein [Myxococcaceae bacterium]
MPDPKEVSAIARRKVAAGAVLLDVRTPQEFMAGHLEGAKNIPVQELQRRLDEVGPKSTPVVVYCAGGMRAAAACEVLRRSGFEDVFNLGAMSAW